VAFAVAALSLLRPYALAFDPLAWAVWGREIGHFALDTSSGPSWKPFPVLFTTPFALIGGSAVPALWLVVARAGGLLALAGAFALADRLAGRWAGVAAAGVTALSPWWAYNTALGNSEGLLAAAVTWAIVAHLNGRVRAALALAAAAALMRPETWPFLIAYGVWLWRRELVPRGFIVGVGVLVPLLWLGPDLVGAGGALDASKTARGIPSPGSAKLATHPLFALLGDTATLFTVPALVAAVAAVWFGGRVTRWLAAGVAAWVAIVAAMTAAGYAGNPRYLVAAAAVGAALAGAGAVWTAQRAAAWWTTRGGFAAPAGASHDDGSPRRAAARPRGFAAPAGALLLVLAVLAVTAGDLRSQGRELDARAAAAAEFDAVIARAGGKAALERCARIRTSTRARSLVAWRFDLPLRDLDARPVRPAVVLRAQWFYGQGLEPRLEPGYRVLAPGRYWQVAAACGAAPQVSSPR